MSDRVGGESGLQQRLQSVFQSVFDDDSIVITDNTTAKDIDGWDSVMNITLIVNVEKEFGIRLHAAEIGALKNVGEMLALIKARANR